MRRTSGPILIGLGWVLLFAGAASAQFGRGGAEWTAGNFDAQRTSWVRSDTKITPDTMQAPGFQYLWKVKLPAAGKASYSQAVLLNSYIGYRGFRSLLFVAGADNVVGVDSDLARVEWTKAFGGGSHAAGTGTCPAGITAGLTRPTGLAALPAPAPPTAASAAVANPFGRGGPAKSGVGEPGQGAVTIGMSNQNAGRGAAAATPPAVGPGAAAPPGSPAANAGLANSAVAAAGPNAAAGAAGRGGAAATPAAGRGGAAAAAGRGPNISAVYGITSDGMLHMMYVSNGEDAKPPMKFLAPGANAEGLIVISPNATTPSPVDNMAFVATTGNCGGVANGVWSMDLSGDTHTVANWDSQGANIAGSTGPVFGTDGTVYVSTGTGGSTYSNAVVALDGKTLQPKGWFKGNTAFSSAPVVFPYSGRDTAYNGKDLVAVANKDGQIYLLDSSSMGGSDHTTSAGKSAQVTKTGTEIGSLATWAEADGTRWILAAIPGGVNSAAGFAANGSASNGTIAAFKLVDDGAKLGIQPVWTSRDMASPLAPMIVNGVVFAVAGGKPGSSAVLYALDAKTGKELWNSGKQIASYVRSGGLSEGAGQMYVTAGDDNLYAFGFKLQVQP